MEFEWRRVDAVLPVRDRDVVRAPRILRLHGNEILNRVHVLRQKAVDVGIFFHVGILAFGDHDVGEDVLRTVAAADILVEDDGCIAVDVEIAPAAVGVGDGVGEGVGGVVDNQGGSHLFVSRRGEVDDDILL